MRILSKDFINLLKDSISPKGSKTNSFKDNFLSLFVIRSSEIKLKSSSITFLVLFNILDFFSRYEISCFLCKTF